MRWRRCRRSRRARQRAASRVARFDVALDAVAASRSAPRRDGRMSEEGSLRGTHFECSEGAARREFKNGLPWNSRPGTCAPLVEIDTDGSRGAVRRPQDPVRRCDRYHPSNSSSDAGTGILFRRQTRPVSRVQPSGGLSALVLAAAGLASSARLAVVANARHPTSTRHERCLHIKPPFKDNVLVLLDPAGNLIWTAISPHVSHACTEPAVSSAASRL